MAKVATTKKNGATIRGMRKDYVIKTYSVTPAALEIFEKKYNELAEYALSKGLRMPIKGHMLSQLMEKAADFKIRDFYPNGK